MSWRRRQLLTVLGVSGVATLSGCRWLGMGAAGDEFGVEVRLADDGSTALVAAEEDEEPNGPGAGSVSVFTRSGDSWSRQAKLVPDDGESGDGFGEAVGLADDGSTALITAETDETSNGEEAGSAYVFTRSGDSWSQQAKLTPDDGDSEDWFGTAAALAGDGSTALVGAADDENPHGHGAGSAYVFRHSGDSWSQQAKLAPEDGDRMDLFGISVALAEDGSTALIGADKDEDPNGTEAGSVYVYTQSDDDWSQQAKLASDDGDSEDWFGTAVSLAGDGSTAVIGAPGDAESNGVEAGSAYVFTRSGGDWSQAAKLAAEDSDEQDRFGQAVTLAGDGSTALVGAWAEEDPNGREAGSAYVFTHSGDDWSQAAKLAPEDGDKNDRFGASVTLAGDGSTALVGAYRDEDPNGPKGGSAYIYTRSGESWSEQVKLAGDQ